MSASRVLCVLIVDNDPRIRQDLQDILSGAGYRVKVVEGTGQALLGQAMIDAHGFRPHVAIVDLRLLDEYSDDHSGFVLLEALRSVRCILYSAYLTPKLVRRALAAGVASVVGKSESPERLLDAIANTAREIGAWQRDLAIHKPAAWTSQRIIWTLFGEDADVPPGIVEDVLSRLFPESREITLETLEGAVVTPRPVIRGRSVVLKAWPNNRLEPLVVKLAPAEGIIEEGQNYFEYVKGNLRGHFHAILEGHPVTFWDLGGVLYSFVGAPRQRLPNFASFYREQQEPQAILQPLRHFFTEVWGDLYKDATKLEQPLFRSYDKVLHLEERLLDFPNKERQRAFRGVPIPLPNPVSWVLRHIDDSAIPSTYQAITHGDLHGDNLFVDESHAWAIDFERSGPGPILRDFAELEVDIVTRLVSLPEEDHSLFYELAVVLAEPSEPTMPFQPTDQLLKNFETSKALNVITGLRSLAHEVTHYSDSREYLWGLLLDTLFVASLVSEESPQREWALLLGAVLCGRLRHWGKEWPPEDWPPITGNRQSLQLHDSKATNVKGAENMLQPEQQAALMVLTEATKFLFSELGKRLDFWKREKGEKAPQTIKLKSDPGPPAIKLDNLEQAVNTEVLYQTRSSIETSLDILRKLTRELNSHREQLLTDTLLDPKTRAYLENRIPELEQLIDDEAKRLQGLLDKVYERK